MRTMIGTLFVGLASLALASITLGEVVEEETWYNADGKVVKTVKRTLTGADARKTADWEPAWVLRESQRWTRPTRRYASSNYRGYGYGSYWGTGYYGGYSSARYCTPRRRTSGFTGYYRSGGSRGSSWGVSIRSRGLSGGICR